MTEFLKKALVSALIDPSQNIVVLNHNITIGEGLKVRICAALLVLGVLVFFCCVYRILLVLPGSCGSQLRYNMASGSEFFSD
jgi:hypothetical protein